MTDLEIFRYTRVLVVLERCEESASDDVGIDREIADDRRQHEEEETCRRELGHIVASDANARVNEFDSRFEI